MKFVAAVRGGILGGAVATAALALAIRALQPALLPWWSAAPLAGPAVRALDWVWTIVILGPAGIALGVGAALVSALVFEYVTRSAGWRVGALVGLALGLVGAIAVGLLPWLAWELGYRYMPAAAPLGPNDSSWVLAAVAAAGTIAGAVAGACYGRPLHVPVGSEQPRWRQIDTQRSV